MTTIRDVVATPYAVLPEHMLSDGDNGWARKQPVGSRSRSLLEGPVFGPDGRLHVVDTPNGRILSVGDDGTFTTDIEYDGWPLGLKFDRTGRLLVADYKNGILTADLATGRVDSLIGDWDGTPFKGPNDLTLGSNGDLYFTDQGITGLQDPTGRVFRYSDRAGLECILDNVPSPNGLVLDLSENALYVAATRANAIWRTPFDSDGKALKVGLFVQTTGGSGPDGITLDSEGRLVVAHVGRGCVWVFDKVGDPVLKITTPGGLHTTNVAYRPDDPETLYITESHSATVYTAPTGVTGRFI